jgi:hypothetical protein
MATMHTKPNKNEPFLCLVLFVWVCSTTSLSVYILLIIMGIRAS